MPPVPLGVRSFARFKILNKGYDNLELKYRLPPDVSHAPIHISFPEGCIIGIAKEQLPVEVSFLPDAATAFTTTIDFLDEDGNRFSVPVTGTADNSIITTYPFLKTNRASMKLLTAEDNLPVRLSLEGAEYEALTSAAVPLQSPFLARWLNATTSKGPFDDLASACLATKGRLVVELAEFFSGKQVPTAKAAAVSNKKEQLDQVVSQFDKLLNFLRSCGALLNAIKPEHLLELEEFQQVITEREARLAAAADTAGIEGKAAELRLWRACEPVFKTLQAQAWTTVLMQIVKVFVLGRITVRQLRQMPCLDAALIPSASDPSLAASNLYSLPEVILLKWLTLHFKKCLPQTWAKVTNFDADLKSGLVLYAVLVSHWPSLERFYAKLKKTPKTPADFAENAALVAQMVADLGLPFPISDKEILNPDPREMLIFVMYLYQTLPQLVPRAEIEFPTDLNVEVMKSIELTNPSGKPLVYTVRLEGCQDFSIGEPVVRIEPKSTVQYQVSCTPRITLPTEARITFMSRRDMGTAYGATLVFSLKTNVDVTKPRQVYRLDAPIYEIVVLPIKVEAPFLADGEYNIRVANVFTAAESRRLVVGERVRWPDAVGVDRKAIKIKKGASVDLNITFLPFQVGTYMSTIIFEDEKLGRFVHELQGEAKPPLPLPVVPFKCDNKGAHPREVPLPFLNEKFELAKRMFIDRSPVSKIKEQMGIYKAASVNAESVSYQVFPSSTMMGCADVLTLKDVVKKAPVAKAAAEGGARRKTEPTAEGSGLSEGNVGMAAAAAAAAREKEKEAAGAAPNALVVTLVPKGPGIYPGQITLVSPYDTRVVDVEFTAMPTVQRVSIDFECLAGQKIVQNIPLINTSDKSITMKAHIVGDCFSGQREMTVPANGVGQYVLTYSPAWTGNHAGELHLTASTNETSVYQLKGTCEEPEAAGALAVECPARQRQTLRLHVPNVRQLGPSVYEVETDLPCVSGNPQLKVDGANGSYDLHVMPYRGGDLKGTVTFQTEDGKFAWFMVDVKVASPPAEATVNIAAEVRTAVTVQIALTNPLDAGIEFEVRLHGDGLLGLRHLAAGPHESVTYNLVYSPLQPGKSAGSVHFVSERVGEFWYKVALEAKPTPPTALPALKCPVGGKVVHAFEVANPLGEEIVLQATSSNARNFNVPASVAVGPFASVMVPLEYVASSLGEPESATLVLSEPRAGTWEFTCSGTGVAPLEMPATKVSATLGSQASFIVDFKNPFSTPVSVSVRLESPASAGVFNLMLKKKGEKLGGFEALQVPLVFVPDQMNEQRATLVVEYETTGSAAIAWTFPIIGLVEAVAQTGRTYRFLCQARSVLEETFEVSLAGTSGLEAPEPFSYELLTHDGPYASALSQCVTVSPADAGALLVADKPLLFRIRLEPRRALVGGADLIIKRRNGSRWRFEINVEASEPEVDGVISVESWVKETGRAVITVSNRSPGPVPFQASFTPDSPHEFAVVPQQGVAEAGAPMSFEVLFSPETYGSAIEGHLAISTPAEEWRYLVQGGPPRYNAPVVPSRVDDRLGGDVLSAFELAHAQGRSRNFLRDNIREARASGNFSGRR